MDINDEIDMENLKYKVKELQEKNEELQVELDITKEQLILSGVGNQREKLIAFAVEMQKIGLNEMDDPEMVVDIWLKSN